MGVTGLWRLVEPAGKPVPVETLENKILAVESERLKRELAILLSKKTAIGALLGKQISPKKNKNTIEKDDDLFKLPALPQNEEESATDSDDEQDSSASSIDLHSVNLESDDFKKLPVKQKYDLLLELKETRKMNSWGKLETLPKKSDNFSNFQMQRLLKRRKVQECIEETEKEMGDIGMSLTELESLLNAEGIETKIEELPTRRIASDKTTRYLLIDKAKQSLIESKKLKEKTENNKCNSEIAGTSGKHETKENIGTVEFEDDLQKAIKMSLECVEEEPKTSTSGCDEDPNTSASSSKADESWTSFMTDSEYSEEECDELCSRNITSVKDYIMQYTDFTHKAIEDLVSTENKPKKNPKKLNVDDVMDEINQEKSIIEDQIDLINDDDVAKKEIKSNDKDSDNVFRTPPLIKSSNDEDICINNENKKDDFDDASLLSIENKNHDCKVDSSSEEIINHSLLITAGPNQDNTKVSNKNIKHNNDISVFSIEDSEHNVICLDTSTEDIDNIKSKISSNKSCSSSEDEFEEVIDIENNTKTPVVQLTLNVEEPLGDDIFADVFECDDVRNPVQCSSITIKQQSEVNDNNCARPIGNKEQEYTTQDHKAISITNNIIYKELKVPKECQSDSFEKIQSPERDKTTEDNPLVNTFSKDISIATKNDSNKPRISEKDLEEMATVVEDEHENLLHEKGRLDRIGRNISEQMTLEAQELLRIFGIPYIIAPMEAEAQCAFLENNKLTDGTITDDSDIWLFGGRTVYKNFFNQKKHVLQFLSERIEKLFNLSREQLILLALLVGSDYTTGVSGVGPVTAMEILASFPSKKKSSNETPKQDNYQLIIEGLKQFKQWVKAGKRTDNITLKKKLKNVKLNEDFPSVRVVQAYLEPNVDENKEKFTWGEIDITILREYAKSKFGWSQSKLDEIVQPVLKRLTERKSQKTVHDYFKRKIQIESIDDQISKRVKAAVKKLDPNREYNDGEETKLKKTNEKNSKSKRAPKKKSNVDDSLSRINQIVKVSNVEEKILTFDVKIPRSDMKHEIIPQREKVKQNLLENKLKAIEIFRKSKIDKKRKFTKRKPELRMKNSCMKMHPKGRTPPITMPGIG
ncbi:unnamed protein product [Leptidea sinapis]|uniref:XPG-I domain-containing protein n=1 Tax=Leptidea sinapis TaxID=189913 RepID=A0A5E4PUY8_9NEOP|nr:unnamed protein product [Leptidea sinapis]